MKRDIPKRLTEYVDGEARMVNSQAFGHREIYRKLAAYEDVALNPADVAPVTRCSECQHFYPFFDHPYGKCSRRHHDDEVVKKADFCSYGVKKKREVTNNEQA